MAAADPVWPDPIWSNAEITHAYAGRLKLWRDRMEVETLADPAYEIPEDDPRRDMERRPWDPEHPWGEFPTWEEHLKEVRGSRMTIRPWMLAWLAADPKLEERISPGTTSGHLRPWAPGPHRFSFPCPCGWTYRAQGDGRQECQRCGRTRIWQSGKRTKKTTDISVETLKGGSWADSEPLRAVFTLHTNEERERYADLTLKQERNEKLGTLDELT